MRAGRLYTHIRLQLDQQLAAYNLASYGLGAAFISDTLALSALRTNASSTIGSTVRTWNAASACSINAPVC